jgi:putative FmdB family regulatory protein
LAHGWAHGGLTPDIRRDVATAAANSPSRVGAKHFPGDPSEPMPIYEYEHENKGCGLGQIFEVRQSISDPILKACPQCRAPVRKLISRPNISTPRTNTELKDLGFTKLVKRDDGVYENVTARDGDSKFVHRDRPETLPNLKKTISD